MGAVEEDEVKRDVRMRRRGGFMMGMRTPKATADFQKEDVEVKSGCECKDKFPVASGNNIRNKGMRSN